MTQTRDEAKQEQRRKIWKFVFISVFVGLVPFFGWPLNSSDLYFVSVGILAVGIGEVLFDRRTNPYKWGGRVDYPMIFHVCLSLVMGLWGALEYGRAQGFEAKQSDAAGEVATSQSLPVNIPPGVMLTVAVVLGLSATYSSVNVPPKVR